MITQPATSCHFLRYRVSLFGVMLWGMTMSGFSAEAAGPNVPWECSNYTDEAQTRCLHAFIEHQQQQIGQLEGQLHAQQEMVGQLKGQVDRQTAAQQPQQLSQPSVAPAVVPPPYVYPYSYAYPAYPPVGIGLYLGRPWGVPGFYGYYGRPYWGPRFYYGYHGHRW